MAIDVSTLRVYSDQDLLTIHRWALANGACGTKRSIAGREMEFPPAKDVMEIISLLEMRILAAGGGGNAALARVDAHPPRQVPFPGLV